MKHTCCERNALALEFPVDWNSASVASDHEYLRCAFRWLHFHAPEGCIVASLGNAVQISNVI